MPWREPAILRGAGSLEKLPSRLQAEGIDNVLLVTDKFLAGTPHFARLQNLLNESGVRFSVYDGTVPNPTLDNISEAEGIYRLNGCNGLVAFGGGSPIDCAKGVGIRIARPGTPIPKMRGSIKVLRKIPYLAAIPTTAGTGSEATVTAVISDAVSHEKYPVNDFVLIPRLAVLDSDMLAGLPKSLTATTGMDALTHAVEAYIGGSNFRGSAEAALEAGRLIVRFLKRAYDDGTDAEARDMLQWAAYRAGFAFTRAYVGYVHAIAHSLGGMYGTPHGLANAVILPHVLEAYGPKAWKRLADFARASGAVPEGQGDQKTAKSFIAYIRAMNHSMEIPEYLDVIREKDIPVLAAAASREANPLYPVPEIYDESELEQLYRAAAGMKKAPRRADAAAA